MLYKHFSHSPNITDSTCEEHKLKAKNSADETGICILVRIAQYSYNNFVNNTLIEINNNPVIVF